MAAPVTETDNGFPRRTAIQPTVPNSPPAGGPAPVAADPKPKRPDPFAKPATQPAAPAKPTAAPESTSGTAATETAKRESAPAAPEAPTTVDWGLAPKSRTRAGMKFKIAGVIGLLLSGAGGYFGYQQYFPKSAAPGAEDDNAPNSADADADRKEKSIASSTGDPFDDPLKMSDDDSLDDLDAKEPRKMGHQPQAAPITRHRKRHSSNDDPLDLGDDLDDSKPPRIVQSEPNIEDEDLSAPSLERPVLPRRKSPTTGGYASRGTTTPKSTRHPSAGPRIHSIHDRDSDLPADIVDDLKNDQLEGYELAEPRHGRKTAGQSHGPKISVIDVRDEPDADEKLDGFTVDDTTTRRAVSKTRIVRSTDGEAFDEAAKLSDVDDRSGFERGSRAGATAIHRRGAVPGDGHIRANRLSADEFSDSTGSHADLYRVQPDDNFWNISRKQYGSARYYQALMRHNLDRVSDPQKLKPGTQISTPSAVFLERKYPDLIEKSPAAASHSTTSRGTGARPHFERPGTERGFDRPTEREPGKESAQGYFYSKSGEPMYRIGADDTLTSIAQRHLGRASRWTEIYEQNQDILSSPDNLTLGTVIRLPGDASRLSLVPENSRRR